MRRLTYQLCLLLVFTIPWESVVEVIPGVSVLTLALGLTTSALWGLSVLAAGRMRRPGAFHAAALALAAWSGVSILWSADAPASAERTGTYLQLLILTLLLWDLLDSPERLRTVMQAYVLGCWVCFLELARVHVTLPEKERITAGAFDQNTLAFLLSMGLPLAWYLASRAWREGPLWLRVIDYAYVPAGALGIFWTGSRSGALAIGVTALYMLVSGGRKRLVRGLVSASVVAALGVGAVMVEPELLPRASLDRILATGDEVSRGSWNGRLSIWQEAIDRFVENPVLGVGSSAFRATAVETKQVPHNFVLSVLAELGLVGLLLFLGVLGLVGLRALGQPRGLTALWVAMLVTWVAHAGLHNYEDKKPTWLLFGLITTSAVIHGSARAGEARVPLATLAAAREG